MLSLTDSANVSDCEINVSDMDLNVYPNPVKDDLSLETENETTIKELTALDISGKIVRSVQLFDNKISLTNLIRGMYFI